MKNALTKLRVGGLVNSKCNFPKFSESLDAHHSSMAGGGRILLQKCKHKQNSKCQNSFLNSRIPSQWQVYLEQCLWKTESVIVLVADQNIDCYGERRADEILAKWFCVKFEFEAMKLKQDQVLAKSEVAKVTEQLYILIFKIPTAPFGSMESTSFVLMFLRDTSV